jgi:hypothetical protein
MDSEQIPDINVPDDNNETEPVFDPLVIPIPLSLSQLMGNAYMNIPMDAENIVESDSLLEEQIQNNSFNQQNKYKEVCSKDFINSLSVQKVSQDMVDEGITCGICLEALELGQNIIELPCKDKHYFHIKGDNCDGIYPWLKENNTCPLCRHEFPSIEKEIHQEESDIDMIPTPTVTSPINLLTIVNQAIQEQEERMMQEMLYRSLQN